MPRWLPRQLLTSIYNLSTATTTAEGVDLVPIRISELFDYSEKQSFAALQVSP